MCWQFGNLRKIIKSRVHILYTVLELIKKRSQKIYIFLNIYVWTARSTSKIVLDIYFTIDRCQTRDGEEEIKFSDLGDSHSSSNFRRTGAWRFITGITTALISRRGLTNKLLLALLQVIPSMLNCRTK